MFAMVLSVSSTENAQVGWCSLGGNQLGKSERLRKLGWEPVASRKVFVFESMPEELDVAFQAAPVLETSPGERKT